jgi:hypothetical protein
MAVLFIHEPKQQVLIAFHTCYYRGLWMPKGTRKRVSRGPSIEADWFPLEVCADAGTSPCPSSSFRSADGSCNNILHPFTWGVALRPYRRSLSPDYADGKIDIKSWGTVRFIVAFFSP